MTTKDKYVLKLIKACAECADLDIRVKQDNRQRYKIKIKDIQTFSNKVGFVCKRKNTVLKELLNGNLMRERDKFYLNIFSKDLKKGTTTKSLSYKYHIPHTTVRIVLRNLYTGKRVTRKSMILSPKGGYFYSYKLI